jgi:GNAT superfamily N-acetyltransferase
MSLLPYRTIRVAVPSDVAAIASVRARSWQVGYRGHMPDSFLEALDASESAAWWTQVVVDPAVTVLVALAADSVIGFCSLLASRDPDASLGTCEVATLYVDPDHWRTGVGTALVARVLEVARPRAFSEVSLWVLATNSGARAFYEASGFAFDGTQRTDSRLGLSIDEVRYRRHLSGPG